MIRLLAVLILIFSFGPAFAQEKAAPSVQQQLDDLKKGQERILQELQELRSALQQPLARAEVAARPAPPAVLNVHGEPFKGSTNATIAIVEYSDFDCGHCAQFATQVFPELDRKYVETGKVRFFFRDLPEAGNAESLLKAKLARCAGEQGQFWTTQAYLFANKPNLVGTDLSREAQALGLEYSTLMACLKEEKYSVMIQRSSAGAARMGIHGTPAFIIGHLTDGGDILRVKEVLLGVKEEKEFEKIVEEVLLNANGSK